MRGDAKAQFPQHTIVRELWLERLVSQQCATSHAERIIPEVCEVPPWFRAVELGLALDQGPSVFWTAANLARINAHNRAQHEGRPKRGRPRKARRTTPAEYQERARRLMARLTG